MINNLLFGIAAAWLLSSIALLRRYRVFNSAALGNAPQRYNQFTFGQVGGVILLYLGLAIAAQILVSHIPAFSSSSLTKPAPATVASTTRGADTRMAASAPSEDPEKFLHSQIAETASRIGIILMLLLLAQRSVVGGVAGLGMSGRQFLPGLRAGLLAAFVVEPWILAIMAISSSIAQYLQNGPLPVHPILEALGDHPSVFVRTFFVCVAVVVAPCSEEMFFRGFLQTALLRLGRPSDRLAAYASTAAPMATVSVAWRWCTILICSALFAAAHIPLGWVVVAPIFFLALALGYLYDRTGNLWASITLHAIFNAVSTMAFLSGKA